MEKHKNKEFDSPKLIASLEKEDNANWDKEPEWQGSSKYKGNENELETKVWDT